MNEFKKIRKSERRAAIDAGLVRRVAEETGKSPAAVSRTFAGKTDRPNPVLVAAIRRFLASLELNKDAA